jgi:hypothetical protein
LKARPPRQQKTASGLAVFSGIFVDCCQFEMRPLTARAFRPVKIKEAVVAGRIHAVRFVAHTRNRPQWRIDRPMPIDERADELVKKCSL